MIVDQFNRRIDDLDVLKLRIAAKQMVGEDGYSITTPNGRAICGYVPDDARPVHDLQAICWRES